MTRLQKQEKLDVFPENHSKTGKMGALVVGNNPCITHTRRCRWARECGGSNNETHKLQVDLAAFFICLKCSRLKSAESVCQSHLQWRWATHPFQKTVGARCPDGS